MRRLILSIMAASTLAACKPEVYTGPLDSPVGNWDGVKAEYYFNGEMVGEADECQYSAISFFKDGLCCIEGVKGTFPYSYDNASGILTVDNTVWSVATLTGEEMVLSYLETTYTEDGSTAPAEETVTPYAEYKGFTIYSDNRGYYYENASQDKIYCSAFTSKDESGATITDFWYDTHTDHFITLVVEVKK